jgi:hypothetical protein
MVPVAGKRPTCLALRNELLEALTVSALEILEEFRLGKGQGRPEAIAVCQRGSGSDLIASRSQLRDQ